MSLSIYTSKHIKLSIKLCTGETLSLVRNIACIFQCVIKSNGENKALNGINSYSEYIYFFNVQTVVWN